MKFCINIIINSKNVNNNNMIINDDSADGNYTVYNQVNGIYNEK